MTKPNLKTFEAAVTKCGGNLSKVADSFKTSRTQVYRWVNSDKSFKEIVNDARMRPFDECLATARVVSVGIPDIQVCSVILLGVLAEMKASVRALTSQAEARRSV